MKKIIDFFASLKLTIFIFTFLIFASIIGTLINQKDIGQKYYLSFWYSPFLLLLVVNITVCALKRVKLSFKKAGFFLTHLSIVIILFGGVIGNLFGHKGFIQISKMEKTEVFYENEKPVPLGFEIALENFSIDTYNSAKPVNAGLRIEDKAGNIIEDINFELNKLPSGLKTKNNLTLSIMQYVPDFSIDLSTKNVISKSENPDNPAIKVLIEKEGKTKETWVFANFGGLHQDESQDFILKFAVAGAVMSGGAIKSFKSAVKILENDKIVDEALIEVNKPFDYKGYTFYQSSYDQNNLSWSGLQVVKDPGLNVVYFGFFLLTIGVFLIFYVQRNDFFKIKLDTDKTDKNTNK